MYSLTRGKQATNHLFMVILTVSFVATISILVNDAAIGDDGDEIDIFLPGGGQGSNTGTGNNPFYSFTPIQWTNSNNQLKDKLVSLILNSQATFYNIPSCEELPGLQVSSGEEAVRLCLNTAGSGSIPKNPHSLIDITGYAGWDLEVFTDDFSLSFNGHYRFDTVLQDLFDGLAQLTINGGVDAVNSRLCIMVEGIDGYDATTLHKGVSANAGELRYLFQTPGSADLTSLINQGKIDILNGEFDRFGFVLLGYDALDNLVSITNVIVDVDEFDIGLGLECPVSLMAYTLN